MAKQFLPLQSTCIVLLILPFVFLRPITEDTGNGDNKETLSSETNTVSILQPRGRKLEVPAEIATEQYKLATEYLIDFGYLPDENFTDYAVPDTPCISEHQLPEEFISGLEWFQRQNGLKVTGKLDEETAETMKLPRCGKHEQRMSYSRGAKWKTDMLTYKIINTTAQLPSGLVRDELLKALKEDLSQEEAVECGSQEEAGISGSQEEAGISVSQEEAGLSVSQEKPGTSRSLTESQVPPLRLPHKRARKMTPSPVQDSAYRLIQEASASLRAFSSPEEAFACMAATKLQGMQEGQRKLSEDLIYKVLRKGESGELTPKTDVIEIDDPPPPPAATTPPPQPKPVRKRGRKTKE